MLASVKDAGLLSLKNGCLYLDQFYVPTRYSDAPLGNLPEGAPKREDAKKAMEFMAQIMEVISNKLP